MIDATGICKGGALHDVQFRYTGERQAIGYRGSHYAITSTRCPDTGLIQWIWRGA